MASQCHVFSGCSMVAPCLIFVSSSMVVSPYTTLSMMAKDTF